MLGVTINDQLIEDNIIMSATDLKGKITYVSNAFCKISSFTKEELIGKPHNIVRHPDMPKEAFKNMWNTIKKNEIWRGEVKNLKKDGSYYYVLATISPEYDKNGQKVGYSAIRQDITAKKQVEEQQSILIEQSKSAGMSEVLTTIAHHWRQPLQEMTLLLEQLQLEKMMEGSVSDETIVSVSEGIDSKIMLLSKTIEEFTTFFKKKDNKEEIKVTDLIKEIKEYLSYTYKLNNITINEIIQTPEMNCFINKDDLEQILVSLIDNSIESLDISKVKEKKITIYCEENEEAYIFKIEDNGLGIKEENKDRVFEPYFSTKIEQNGTGLGLYVSKIIVERNNGFITFEQKDDKTSFIITLPK